MADMDRLNGVLGVMSLLFAVYVAIALWFSWRRDAARSNGHRPRKPRALGQSISVFRQWRR